PVGRLAGPDAGWAKLPGMVPFEEPELPAPDAASAPRIRTCRGPIPAGDDRGRPERPGILRHATSSPLGLPWWHPRPPPRGRCNAGGRGGLPDPAGALPALVDRGGATCGQRAHLPSGRRRAVVLARRLRRGLGALSPRVAGAPSRNRARLDDRRPA